jgi:protocatechuate 3,4-dioxygenase beta subunit
VGLFWKSHKKHSVPASHSKKSRKAGSRFHICRFEQMESRDLLSVVAPTLNIGATYYQPHDGNDSVGSLMYISWNGGAAGTHLIDLIIDTHKVAGTTPDFSVQNPVPGDVFFHTAPSGIGGTMGGVPPTVAEWSGSVQPTITVSNDSTLLDIHFASTDFSASGRLVLKVNVDIMESWSGGDAKRVVEGADFDGTSFEAVFSAAHYQTATVTGFFRNVYNNPQTTYGLNLPDDNYDNTSTIFTTGMPPAAPPEPVFTAGVLASLTQTPLPITLSGTVYEDYNVNNVLNPGEPGILGVTLTLWRLDNGTYVSTGLTKTTDLNGNYSFTGLAPDTYRIVETQPDGYLSVGDTPGTVNTLTRGVVTTVDILSAINLDGGDNSIHNDFAEVKPAKVSGYVYVDANNNGHYDAGETPIAGVTLTLLDANGNSTGKTATTDSAGYYHFDGLMPGGYGVSEAQPVGYLDGLDAAGTAGGAAHNPGDLIDGFSLIHGQSGLNYDFGELLPAKVSGYVYVDANNNGIFDTGETPISGVVLTLLDSSGKSTGKTASTDSTGYYHFDNLAPGTYGVSEAQPNGYLDGLDKAGPVGGAAHNPGDLIDGIPLASGTTAPQNNFGELLPAKVSGYVYVDANNNGIFDAGETPISGVVLTLLDSSGNSTGKTATTDSSGYYHFDNLAPGTYGVSEAQPAGYLDGLDKAGPVGGAAHNPGDLIDGIPLASGASAPQNNFGELLPAKLSGYVYVDANNNGVFDAGETPISGVVLTLLNSSGQSTGKTATTDASGYYEFANLAPGTYGVSEAQPAGYFDGLDKAGPVGGTAHNPGDLIDGIPLVAGTSAPQNNFGELLPATISGRVFVDNNQNNTYDAGEPLLSGVTIWLLDSSGNQITSTTTNSSGKYSFTNLKPGVYGVEEMQPAGYFEGSDQVGSAGGQLNGPDQILQAQLGSGVNGVSYDFWEVTPAEISGYVFQDGPTIVLKDGDPEPNIPSIRTGILTANDIRLSGVTLQLCDGSGYPMKDAQGNIITTKTDANGYYEFTMLQPGKYSVIEIQPSGYIPGIDTAGTNGGMVVNKYAKVDAMTLSTLAVDPSGSAIVRITVDPGDTAVQYNFSEVLEQRQPANQPANQPGGFTPPGVPTPLPPLPPAAPFSPPQLPGAPYIYTPTTVNEFGFGGATAPNDYDWHLSVIDAGQPRSENSGNQYADAADNTVFDPVSWSGPDLAQSQWILADENGTPIKTIRFGMAHATPVTGDWDGTGTTKVGVFLDGLWFLDLNGNGVWDTVDLWVKLGHKGDQPVTGDWNGDGKTDIGIFGPMWKGDMRAIAADPGLPDSANPPALSRPKNVPPDPADAATGYRTLKKGHSGRLRSDLIDHVFKYGEKGDIAVIGDWNGDGIYNIGIFRDGVWFLDMDGDGRWSEGDLVVEFGQPGDLPVVGDWTGDGISKIGVYRNGKFILDTNNNHKIDADDKVIELGHAGDKPVAGDWTGNGVDKVGVYQDSAPPEVPLQALRQ